MLLKPLNIFSYRFSLLSALFALFITCSSCDNFLTGRKNKGDTVPADTLLFKGKIFSVEIDSSDTGGSNEENFEVDSVGIEGVKVSLDEGEKITSTDSSGIFVFNVAEGKHMLKAKSEGYQPIDTTLNIPLTQEKNQDKPFMNLWLKKSERDVFTIKGKVNEIEKKNMTPLDSVKVLLDSNRIKVTDSEGEFQFFVYEGRHNIEVLHPVYIDTVVTSNKDHHINFVLQNRNDLSGKVFERKMKYGLVDTSEFEYGYLTVKKGVSDAIVKVGGI